MSSNTPPISGVNVSPEPVPSTGDVWPADRVDMPGFVVAPPNVSGMLLSTHQRRPRIEPTGPSSAEDGSKSPVAAGLYAAVTGTRGRLLPSTDVANAFHTASLVTTSFIRRNRLRPIWEASIPTPE